MSSIPRCERLTPIEGAPGQREARCIRLTKTILRALGFSFVALNAALQSPNASADVLYDQYNNAGTNATVSQDFETAYDAYDSQLYDDFIVPACPGWPVDRVSVDGAYFQGTGPAQIVRVQFYENASGAPGALISSFDVTDFTGGSLGSFVIPIPPQPLAPGHYWLSVMAVMDSEFGSNDLRLVRESMINGDAKADPPRKPWSRQYVNSQIHRLCRIFKWGAEHEMVPVWPGSSASTRSAGIVSAF